MMSRNGAPGPPPEKRLSEMLTTHMDPQLTGSDVVTTEDGHLLTLNQVMELGKIEHKFKPTIVKKEFNWELPADPDPKSDNYYNGIVSKELGDSSNIGETLLGVIRRESVRNQSDYVCDTNYTTMRAIKSVLIVTRMGYVEGVFTSFRALANSQGATRINIEGEYEPYTETELKDIAANGQTFTYFGEKCRISARTLNK